MQPQSNTKSNFAKIGLQGGTGSGKSRTAALLALGISAELSNHAPVAVWDSEPAFHFIKPLYEIEKVPLLILAADSFKSWRDSMRFAEKEGACCHISDQMAAAWKDILRSFSDDSGYIGMQRQNQLRSLWDEATKQWRDLPIDSIACGRLGWEFEEYEEDGHLKFTKGDTKMKAGGGESFGYEAILQCEMTRKQEAEGPRSSRRKLVRHICTVLKDQTAVLDDAQFTFKNLREYKSGDYKFVFRAFLPHLEFLRKISGIDVARESSRELVHTESYWQKTDKERASLLEEWNTTMNLIWAGQTAAEKRARALVGEEITGVRSQTRFEAFPVAQIQSCVLALMRLEERIRVGGETPASELELQTICRQCKAEMGLRGDDPGRGVEQFYRPPEETVLASTLRKSVQQIEARKIAAAGD